MLLEHAQQLCLRDQRRVGDLVEKKRALVGELEAPGLAVVRSGKRALLVAEDFRLEQRVGQRGAVDRLEVRDASRAQLVDHARDDFLARSRRSENQHGDVGFGRGSNPLEHDQHLLVLADHFAEALHGRRLVLGRHRRAPLQKCIEQIGERLIGWTRSDIPDRTAPDGERDPEIRELADAVLDVHTQPPEGLHQRFDVEALLGPRTEVAQDSGAQRRLHQPAEPCFKVRRLGRARRRGRAGAPGAEGQVIHLGVHVIGRKTPARQEGVKLRLFCSSPSDNARSAVSSRWHRGCGGRGRRSGACRRWSRSARPTAACRSRS